MTSSCSLSLFRSSGYFLHEATEYILKLLCDSLYSTQVCYKGYICPGWHLKLQRIFQRLPEQGSLTLGLEHKHVCCGTSRAVPKNTETNYIELTFPYRVKNLNEMFSACRMSIKKTIPSFLSSPRSTHTFIGIDMNPVRPKRKEKPAAPEIPEPGMPEYALPGFPVPGFPDVTIPIVPEFPMPEIPEVPIPQGPGKFTPIRKSPLPGRPVPILEDFVWPRWPLSENPIEGCPILAVNSPLGWNDAVKCIFLRSCIDAVSIYKCYIFQKYQVSDGLIIPPMIKAMLLRNHKIYIFSRSKDDSLLTFPKISSTQRNDIVCILENQRLGLTGIKIKPSDVLGMTCEQFEKVFYIASKLQEQINHPKVNRSKKSRQQSNESIKNKRLKR